MRSQNIFMFGVCILVAAAIGYFAFFHQSPRDVMNRIAAQFSTPRVAAPDDPPVPATDKPAAPVRARIVRNPSTPKASFAVVAEPEVPPTTPPAAAHPQPEEILFGMERAQLLSRFPKPAIETSTIKDGDLFELIVYQRRDQTVSTFVQLQNGVVTNVYAGRPTRQLTR